MIHHPFTINFLNTQEGLIHAFSPKSFESEDGTEKELNFGTWDQGQKMAHHRQWFLRSVGIDNDEVYRVRQVHGNRIFELQEPLKSVEKVAAIASDAIVTRLVNQPIAVLTADCVPVVIYDSRRHAAGVVHAGRKGTSQNILFETIATLKKAYGSHPEDILVGMGPGIGGCCYEVDAPCIDPFKENYPDWAQFISKSPSGKYMLDLFAANTADAKRAGLLPQNIYKTGLCTYCEPNRFFSYRRDKTTGRMMTVAMLSPL